ncbi:acetyl-CoA C-acyltransferase [Sneathiella sp. P13V-1]|uniref:thiolase family protein n=1 Tax=Sneathiella sp. P13V-1 TaxID=2697366 RepID=UPI00187B75A8|nr:thiolase family protein [Sneathiella sp. P13V-1]MBE7638430.1 acetyl-CoA C-acyltransferase [Sneathiella sp. P13V-1]
MKHCYVVAAKRTAVVPRGGAFNHLQADELAAPVISALLEELPEAGGHVDQIIMGNALYGGGNPARLAALRAGIPEGVPALTLDTQCCAGMDAVRLGANFIRTGEARAAIVGGLESYSRSPIRSKRPMNKDDKAEPYLRPPFTPWAERDPDMVASAGDLSAELNCSREDQEKYAQRSHEKSLASQGFILKQIVPVEGVTSDKFTRRLSPSLLKKLPVVYGKEPYELTSATIAVEADAAAALLLVSEDVFEKLGGAGCLIEHSVSVGTDPAKPALSPLNAIQTCIKKADIELSDIALFEMMEAFALQGVLLERFLGEQASHKLNKWGGALSRGHPIGASGAINLVHMFHQLVDMPKGARGLASIAAAGGLGSALMLKAFGK